MIKNSKYSVRNNEILSDIIIVTYFSQQWNEKVNTKKQSEIYCKCQPIAEVGILGIRVTKFKLTFTSPILNSFLLKKETINLYLSSENTNHIWVKIPIAFCERKSSSKFTLFINQGIKNKITQLLKFDQENFCQIRCTPRFRLEFNLKIKDIKHNSIRKCHFLPIQYPELNEFHQGKFKDMKYDLFKPKRQDKNPLIIFLHGAGEGGENQSHLLADRAVMTFIEPDTQHYFDYPYVLAPQCPDFWLKKFKLNNKIFSGKKDYTEILIKLINSIINDNKSIDTNRIYIIGASMGGYQGLRLLSHSPKLFAAGIIACPAKKPTTKQLKSLEKTPLWFLHSWNDNIVPIKNCHYIINHLQKNNYIQATYYSDVNIEGITLDPHCVFLYLYENIPHIKNISIFHWLSQQRRSHE